MLLLLFLWKQKKKFLHLTCFCIISYSALTAFFFSIKWMIFLFLFPLFFPKLNIDVSSSNPILIYYKKKVEKAKQKEKKEREKQHKKISFLFVYNVSSLCAAHRHGHFVHLHQPLHITQYSLKKKSLWIISATLPLLCFLSLSFFILSFAFNDTFYL